MEELRVSDGRSYANLWREVMARIHLEGDGRLKAKLEAWQWGTERARDIIRTKATKLALEAANLEYDEAILARDVMDEL